MAALLSASAPGLARAEEPEARLSPPELLEEVAATYPPAARAEHREGTVILDLTIDAAGRVTDATVLSSAGADLDEAARAAMLASRFRPAQRGDQRVASRIHYPSVFALPEVAPAPVGPPAPLLLAPPAEPAPPPPSPAVAEVTVHGSLNEAQRLQQSAEAVTVVDTRTAKAQTADLGEVMARTQGVAIRRDGGLGSSTRFSLNGLYDDQVRFFLDGIPLSLAGYPYGISTIPVNLVERVEVYRGVVPVRFGADALGGAVNVVSDTAYRTRLGASLQTGSFGTERLTLDAHYRDEGTGLVAGGTGFFDVAKNNYRVAVSVPDAQGKLVDAEVNRFHDAYAARGATLEGGFVDKPWAQRLLLRVFASSYEKQIQNSVEMTVPYGEARQSASVVGTHLRWEVDLAPRVSLELVGAHAYLTTRFVDDSRWVYDWFGRRTRPRSEGGEIDAHPTDQTTWQHDTFGRALLTWKPGDPHTLRITASAAYSTRHGQERLLRDPGARDPLSAVDAQARLVSGVEYQLDGLDDRLSNVVFAKDYLSSTDAEEPLTGGGFRARSSSSHTQGVGDSMRVKLASWLLAKASYEFATRLPSPDEVFGDGALLEANLDLVPETSHNANLGPRAELKSRTFGDLTLDVNGFLRDSDHLIVLLTSNRGFVNENVAQARGLGLENAARWEAPGRWLVLDGTLTWQDVRNESTGGSFVALRGDRIPNRPWLFASWGARLRFPGFPGARDTVEPFYGGRYVHSFYRGWESLGSRDYKEVVDAQVTHLLGVTWTLIRREARVSSTLEIDNLTGARVYDNFGVQRPGRAFYAKVTLDL